MEQPAPHNMYFVAILCPQTVNEKVLLFKNWMKEQFGCAAALRSPAHITLVPPFWLGEEKELLLLQALQSFGSTLDELKIELDGFSHFGSRVLFVSVKESPALKELKGQVEGHFIKSFGSGIQKDDRPFHPHVTIANRDLKPSAFEKAWQHFNKREFNEAFLTNAVTILKLGSGRWNVIGEKQWQINF